MPEKAENNPAYSPVFVFGALRSGTTLMRLILKNHPGLDSPGEADFLFDYVRRDPSQPSGWHCDRARLMRDRIFRAKEVDLPGGVDGSPDGIPLLHAIVDAMAAKTPDKQMVLNVHRHAHDMIDIFPDAKVIHLLRDPRDVARSSIGMGWSGNSYHGVRHWIGTEKSWDNANIPAEQVLTVHFEQLMAHLEAELTRITDFLGLSFEPAMLDYHKTSTYAPPDPKIAQKWKTKASAREIALLEGRMGPLLKARGYEPAGDPIVPGRLERTWLETQHKINRWRHNIRRYGAGLFFGHHAARVLGLKDLAARLDARQEAIRVQQLQ